LVRMRPTAISPDSPPGEKLLFSKLSELLGADNWIALHSLDIFGDIPNGQGEADFVILIPGQGLLVVEVKSHLRVRAKNGIWTLGNDAPSTRGPVKQAWNAAHAIRNYLQGQGVDIFDVPIVPCVWFTNANDEEVEPSIEWQEWMLLYAKDMPKPLKQTINRVFSGALSMFESGSLRFSTNRASALKLEAIAKALRPEVAITKTAEMRVAEINEWAQSAVDQQIDAVAAIRGLTKPFLLQGIAGTGKTHIAIHEAKLAHLRGERTLFTCFNALLADYLNSQLADYSRVEVKHFHKFMTDLVGSQNTPENDPDWWSKTLPSLTLGKLVELPLSSRFDTLIVDEAQDLGLTAYLEVMDFALEKGLSNSYALFTGDFAHQGIYIEGTQALSNYKMMMPGLTVLNPLSKNCRNTKILGDQVMSYVGEPQAYSGYLRKDEGLEPRPGIAENNEQIPKMLFSELDRLSKLYKSENIVVLSSNKKMLEQVLSSKNIARTELGRKRSGKIRWGSVQSFKGLEALAVLLVEFEPGYGTTKETFYVAATRTLSEFVFLYPSSLLPKVFRSDRG